MSRPLVSVVVPTFNGERFVDETLRSVLAQTETSFELFVCDDGSTDATLEIVRRIGPPVTVLPGDHGGVSVARNRGLERASGSFIAFLDQDDLWEPTFLSAALTCLEEQPHCVAVSAESRVIDAQGQPYGLRSDTLGAASGQIFRSLLQRNFIPLESLLVRSDALHAVGGFDVRWRFVEDWDLCLRLAKWGPFAHLPAPLARYRIHDRNLTHRKVELLEECAALLGQLLEESVLTDDERGDAARSRARYELEAAWARLGGGDVTGAFRELRGRHWRRRPLHAAKVAAAAVAVGVLPASVRDRLLRRARQGMLYGVRPRG